MSGSLKQRHGEGDAPLEDVIREYNSAPSLGPHPTGMMWGHTSRVLALFRLILVISACVVRVCEVCVAGGERRGWSCACARG